MMKKRCHLKIKYFSISKCNAAAIGFLINGRPSFRLVIPETYSSDFKGAIMGTLPEVRAARCRAGKFRCKSYDPDYTSGNHAAICQ